MKTIVFFTCSNGYGHLKRIIEVSKHLIEDYHVTVFCEKYQYDKFKHEISDLPIIFKFYNIGNIRWDTVLENNDIDFKQYTEWIEENKIHLFNYDIVVSDNVVGLLKHRKDIILMGSFLWHDVYQNKFGINELSTFDSDLISENKPRIITNKYVETGTLREYSNKIQFGWGCEYKPTNIISNIKRIVVVPPSLTYLDNYTNFFNTISDKYKDKYLISNDIRDSENSIFVIRPGIGMLTHCMENGVFPICVYDKSDSSEIIETAKLIEKMGLGISHDINDDFSLKNIENLINIYLYKRKTYEFNAYKEISNYIRQVI
jgi:hypothetical protein